MQMKVMTYGNLPTREVFDRQFAELVSDGEFRFGNDKRVGTCALSPDELWAEIQKAHAEWDGPQADADKQDEAGEWCSTVLECLGIEWV